ncbi:MAG: hypothetical protein HON98_00755 [Chloroflexi bacterium]|jgi:hypothetical protein|nr:hypothetical protein [Chloroflexota bacterium]MBT3669684.1 hypothetical protein [Chloroflexota bacterium]MBT4003444.1 hypothetical protein [Chloroflexota bacterium]MBT4305065.1 hypothetical protein [Chloroflexota bacterium]MBT4533414.1 hypothetical protein [Chloroflexota bacterium]
MINKLTLRNCFTLLLCCLLIVACGEEPPEPTPVEENIEEEDNGLLSVSDIEEETDIDGEPVDIGEIFTNILTPKAEEEVEANWDTSTSLDSLHQHVLTSCADCHTEEDEVNKDVPLPNCHGCHNLPPNRDFTSPPDQICLNCHGGSYGAVSDLTRNYKPVNPHDYHYTTDVRCIVCHPMHETFDGGCELCHEDYELTKN